MKKKICVLFILLLLLLSITSGCSTAPTIKTTQDEIKIFNWQNTDEYGKKISLSFKDDNAILTLISGKEKAEISGLVFVDETSIQITDQKLQSTYSFDYTLTGKELTLKYGDYSLTLNKI